MPATATSTGPKTDTGKATSSRNALRHGLTAKQIVLPGEDPAEYEALRDSLTLAHQPAEGLESIVIDQIAQCVWRLNRARRMEADTLEEQLTRPAGESGNELDKVLRYMAAIERELHRSVRELTNLQSTRCRNQTAVARAQAQQEIAAIHAHVFAVPDLPPLTREDVARAVGANSELAETSVLSATCTGNYETESHTRHIARDEPRSSSIKNGETNPRTTGWPLPSRT